ESLEFLTTEQWNGVYFELIGNEGWYPKGGEKAFFGQQPVDAGYLVEAYVAASEVSDKYKHLELARLAFEWFLGRNRLNAALYDFADGSVADGMDSNGISANQGAESVVCYLLAVLALSELKAFNLPSENPPIHTLSELLAVSVFTRLFAAPATFVSFLRSPPRRLLPTM